MRDRSQYYELSVYVQRPLQVKRVIDHMTGASPLATTIDPDRIGIYGFSRGGYTALVAIGANPDFSLSSCRGAKGGPTRSVIKSVRMSIPANL